MQGALDNPVDLIALALVWAFLVIPVVIGIAVIFGGVTLYNTFLR